MYPHTHSTNHDSNLHITPYMYPHHPPITTCRTRMTIRVLARTPDPGPHHARADDRRPPTIDRAVDASTIQRPSIAIIPSFARIDRPRIENPSTHLPIHPSIHPSIIPSIHRSDDLARHTAARVDVRRRGHVLAVLRRSRRRRRR